MIGGGDGDHRRQLLSNECEVVVACGDTDPSKSSAESEERLALLKDGFRRARRQVTMRPRRMIMMAGSVTLGYSGVTLELFFERIRVERLRIWWVSDHFHFFSWTVSLVRGPYGRDTIGVKDHAPSKAYPHHSAFEVDNKPYILPVPHGYNTSNLTITPSPIHLWHAHPFRSFCPLSMTGPPPDRQAPQPCPRRSTVFLGATNALR